MAGGIALPHSIFFLDCYVALTQYIVVPDNKNETAPGDSGLFNRIAVLRAERGISRQDLADAVGVNYQTIGFLERGDYGPSLKLAFQIAEALKAERQQLRQLAEAS